jgi:uncharacterized protein YfiM (DUF2279 family)
MGYNSTGMGAGAALGTGPLPSGFPVASSNPNQGSWLNPAGAIGGMLGFGPGSSWTPLQAAQSAQREQQLNQERATAQINKIFDNPARKAEYANLANTTTQYYTGQLNRQKGLNDLRMKFSLANSGNTGGSQQAYDSKLAGQDYIRGLLAASQRGQSAGVQLQQQDQQARAQLLAEAQSGLNVGEASTQASQMLQSALSGAKASSTQQALGNAFGDFSNIYSRDLQNQANIWALKKYGLLWK